jgi:transglutaminase-like putative cysteine protease
MRRADFLILFVLIGMVLAVTNAVAVAEWIPGLRAAGWVALLALVTGVALSYSHFPSWSAHLTSIMYGMFTIGIAAGRSPYLDQDLTWRERVLQLLDKINAWLYELVNNGSSSDRLIFFLLVCILAWVIAYFAAWNTYRHQRIWLVTLPAGFLLFVNTYYYGGDAPMEPYLAIFLIGTLLMFVHTFLQEREIEWMNEQIVFSPELRRSFIFASIVIGGLVLLSAWRIPDIVESKTAQEFFSQMTQPYNEIQARFGRMFASVRNFNVRPVDSFENQLTLTGPRDLPEDEVMIVNSRTDIRHYWRAQSFDFYDGSTWTNTVPDALEVTPLSAPITQTLFFSRTRVDAQFNLARGTNALYTSGQPLWANVPASANYAPISNNTFEIVQFRLSTPLLGGNKFTSMGSVSVAEVERLRNSPNQQPRQINQRYLQVPQEVPQRVRELARNIAGLQRTNFDKALAIEKWLRDNVLYDENAQAPPNGREAADYVLFETRRAYCTYYSTAMVVMLRSLGIPARMATGYAQGEPQPDTLESSSSPNSPSTIDYLVRAKDSHAWVEVFFTDYGWVEFEPTAGQQPIVRRSAPTATATPQPTPTRPPTATPIPTLEPTAGRNTPTTQPTGVPPTPTPTLAPNTTSQPNQQPPAPPVVSPWLVTAAVTALLFIWGLLPYVLGVILVIGALILAVHLAESYGFNHLKPVARAYAMLSRWATWLGLGATLTPHEQAQKLADLAPRVQESARQITDLYTADRFALQTTRKAEDDTNALTAWAQARKELRKSWLKFKLRLSKPK